MTESRPRPLRLAVAAPIDLRSAIGRMSVSVADGLAARGHDICLIATDATPPHDQHATPLRVLDGAPRHGNLAPDVRDAPPFDAMLVNMGDHYPFHAGTFPLLKLSTPMVGIFHDAYLRNLFNGWLEATTPEADRHFTHHRILVALYGEGIAPLADRAWANDLTLAEIMDHLPMTEWLAHDCSAALTHADFYAGRVRAACLGPVRTAGLPVPDWDIDPPPPRSTDGPRTFRLLTVGMMNRNKCVDEVVEALAASADLRSQVDYHLAGRIEAADRARLEALARQSGVRLTVHGEVSDAELRTQLGQCDAIACLRRPVLEGASGSAVEALLAGRPTLVADAGFYAELPDDMVFRVPAAVAPADLTPVLERMVGDPDLCRTIGDRARHWARARFALEPYLDTLETLVGDLIDHQRVDRSRRRLHNALPALGLQRCDPATLRIDRAMAGFIASRAQSG